MLHSGSSSVMTQSSMPGEVLKPWLSGIGGMRCCKPAYHVTYSAVDEEFSRV